MGATLLLTFLLLADGGGAPGRPRPGLTMEGFDLAVQGLCGRVTSDPAGATRHLKWLLGYPPTVADGQTTKTQRGEVWQTLGYAYERQKRPELSAAAYNKAGELLDMPRRSSCSAMTGEVDPETLRAMQEEAAQLEAELRVLEARTSEGGG